MADFGKQVAETKVIVGARPARLGVYPLPDKEELLDI